MEPCAHVDVQAFDEYKNKTCIRFVPKDDNDFDYIYVKANKNYGFVGVHNMFRA
jgi:hypothetical protein